MTDIRTPQEALEAERAELIAANAAATCWGAAVGERAKRIVEIDRALSARFHEPPVKEGYAFDCYPVRWKAYKPDGARQMKAKGRWQRMDEYGGWTNCEAPTVLYVDPPDVTALRAENARLTAERDEAQRAWVAATDERLWRYWSQKAVEAGERNAELIATRDAALAEVDRAAECLRRARAALQGEGGARG